MKSLVIESLAFLNTGLNTGDWLAALTLQGRGRAGPSPRLRAGRPSLLTVALVGLQLMTAASFAATVTLRLELTSNATFLVVSPISAPGALFILAAPELTSLMATPSMLLLTNTPLTNELRLPVPSAGGFSKQGFFRVAHWAGLAPALVDIPAGTFLMGAPPSEAERFVWDGPQTEVAITYSFKMGKFELTQAEYQALMGNNPSYFPGTSNRPVEQVSWTNAMGYCAQLTASQQFAGCLPAGWAYRLPTEAEWEYACRAAAWPTRRVQARVWVGWFVAAAGTMMAAFADQPAGHKATHVTRATTLVSASFWPRAGRDPRHLILQERAEVKETQLGGGFACGQQPIVVPGAALVSGHGADQS